MNYTYTIQEIEKKFKLLHSCYMYFIKNIKEYDEDIFGCDFRWRDAEDLHIKLNKIALENEFSLSSLEELDQADVSTLNMYFQDAVNDFNEKQK